MVILGMIGAYLDSALFSPSPPPKEERGGVRRPMVFQLKSPHPQPSPRLGGEREWQQCQVAPLLLGHHREIPVFAHSLVEFTVNPDAAIRGVFATTVVIKRKSWQTKRLMKNQRIAVWRGLRAAALLLSGGLVVTAQAQTNSATESPASATVKPLMHSRIFQWSDMPAQPTNIGVLRNFFDAPTATLDNLSCHVTTLDPGKEPHPAHRHPEEELLIIKEGTLEVVQNGVTNQVGAGGMVFCASNELHGWRNSSTNPVTYYVIHISPHDLAKPAPAEAKPSNK